MNIELISRQQLEIINRRSYRFPLQTAEKDYFLAMVMQIISQSTLDQTLVFKGGTALHHCYLDQYRFSEDLDFSSNQTPITIDDIKHLFSKIEFLNIKEYFLSKATIKVKSLQYSGPLLQTNSLKMEIDVEQNVLLPPKSVYYKNVWGLDFKVNVMDIKEICAEKIRAMSDRARYRDFYDLYLVSAIYQIDFDEIITYLTRKEIRKPISKANIQHNWRIVGTQKSKEMSQVFYSQNIADFQIENLIEKLPFEEIIP